MRREATAKTWRWMMFLAAVALAGCGDGGSTDGVSSEPSATQQESVTSQELVNPQASTCGGANQRCCGQVGAWYCSRGYECNISYGLCTPCGSAGQSCCGTSSGSYATCPGGTSTQRLYCPNGANSSICAKCGNRGQVCCRTPGSSARTCREGTCSIFTGLCS